MRTKIVDNVYSIAEIEMKRWTFTSFMEVLGNGSLEAAASLGLIGNTSTCANCSKRRSLVRQSKNVDGLIWNCSRKSCKTKASVRKGSFFNKSHLPLDKLLTLLFCWCLEMPQCRIQEEVHVSSRTIVDWMSYIRDVCELDIINNPMGLGGGRVHEETQQSKVHSHLMEKLWKRREKGHLFPRILMCIREQYSVEVEIRDLR